jgi:hypothetical protein
MKKKWSKYSHEHPDTENWLVLDDLDLHNEEIATHQVMTDSEYGLTEDDVLKAIKILNM